MLSKKKLIIGSLILGLLGFSPTLMSIIGRGNKKGDLELNPKYYNDKDEQPFITEKDKDV